VKGTWAWSDAWVLTAACIRETNPVSLVDLIEAGDYINHAILLDEEINGALSRLAAAGLVQVEGYDIVITDQGQRLYEEATSSRLSVIEMTDAVSRALNRLDLREEIPTGTQIPTEVLRAAKERWRVEPPPELEQQGSD
jgi:hypothetical protein